MTENKKKNRLIIIFIILFGFILRVIGLKWGGEDQLFYPDEYNVVNNIKGMVENGTLIHSNWTYPSMSSSKIITVLLMVVSKIHSLRWIDYYYVTRFSYVLFSTTIILLSYLIIKKSEGKNIAIVFSLFIAICPSYVRFAKIVVGDTPVMMFWLIVALIMDRYISSKRNSDVILMSFFAACAFMEKWNGAGIAIFIAAGIIYFNIKNIKRLFIHGVISFTTWLVSILIIAPNIIKEFQSMLLMLNSANPSPGSWLLYGQLNYFFAYCGIGTVLLVILGLYSFISQKNEIESEKTSHFSYWVIIICWLQDWLLCEELVERHGFIIFWGGILFAILGCKYLVSKGKKWKIIGVSMVVILGTAWLIQSLLADAVAVRTWRHDTRSIGVAYLNSMGATVDNSTGEYYTPFNPPYTTVEMDIYDINSIIYLDENEQPCITVPDKQFVIIGEYSYKDRTGEGYSIVRDYCINTETINSNYDISYFGGSSEFLCGKWYYLELDTVRNAINRLKRVCTCDTIGPWIQVYDISNFTYKPRED